MKKNYYLNNIGWIGIILIMLTLTFTSCKKDEYKDMTPAPTPASMTVETFVLTTNVTYPTSMAFAVEDTIQRFVDDTVVKYNIPLQYNSKYDTMTVTSRTPFTAGQSAYTIDHIVKYNTAYELVGWSIHSSGTTLKMQFNQRVISTGYQVGSYDLTYTKI